MSHLNSDASRPVNFWLTDHNPCPSRWCS